MERVEGVRVEGETRGQLDKHDRQLLTEHRRQPGRIPRKVSTRNVREQMVVRPTDRPSSAADVQAQTLHPLPSPQCAARSRADETVGAHARQVFWVRD